MLPHDISLNTGGGVMDDPTLSEIYRVLLEVRAETLRTNGRVDRLETRSAVHDWAFALLGSSALVWLGVWLAKVL